jgi:hypothetical protein
MGGFRVVEAAAPPRPAGLRRPPNRKRDLPEGLQWIEGYDPGRRVATRFAHLKGLPDHPLFMDIHDRIVAGVQLWKIAKWIQAQVAFDDPLGSASITMPNLYTKLRRYKLMLPDVLFLPPTYLDTVTKGVEVHIDVVPELASLIRYQQMRITQFAPKEKDWPLGITSEQQRKEVGTLADLLMKMRDTQIALGLTPGVLPGPYPTGDTAAANVYEIQTDPLSQFLANNPSAIPQVMDALDHLIIEGKAKRLADGEPPPE